MIQSGCRQSRLATLRRMAPNSPWDGAQRPDRNGRGPVIDLLTRLGRRVHHRTSAPNPTLMAAIAVVLIGVAVFSWQALEISVRDVRWELLGLSALLVPFSVVLTAAEYRLVARASRVTVDWTEALRITVIGTVANLLPIPGAAVVRVNDLVARDSRASHAVGATVGVGVLWLGWALILSGSALMIEGALPVGGLMGALGLIAVIASWLVAPVRAGIADTAEWIVAGSAIELAALGIGAIRIWLTLAALGVEPTGLQAVGLVAAGAIASTVGIVPGGLGIRELIAGALAPLVDLEVAAAIVTIAIVRVVGMLISAPIAASLARRAPKHE